MTLVGYTRHLNTNMITYRNISRFSFCILVLWFVNVQCSSNPRIADRGLLGDACETGDYGQAKQALDDGADPNVKFKLFKSFSDSTTPLLTAVGFGRPKIVSLLLLRDANPNMIANISDESPLMLSVVLREGNSNSQLQKAGDMVNFQDSSGVMREKVYSEIIPTLLKAGASANFSDKQGTTPLHRAAQFCDSVTVQLLLQYGANPNVKDRFGKTPLDLVDDSCKSVREELEKALSENKK
jgi:hypothetical protein